MRVIPAIDLRRGQCVRLLQGDFDRCTRYERTPIELARHYEQLGFAELHIVDLDGALTGNQSNRRTIQELCAATSLRIQLGGGIRDRDTVERWLDSGVTRCVVGSVAVTDPDAVQGWMETYGTDRIVPAFDVRSIDGQPRPAISGWTCDTDVTLWDCVARYVGAGARQILCTDITRDGAMTGPSLPLYEELMTRFPSILLQASGGVRSVEDLAALDSSRADAAIVGRALLDGRLDEKELGSFLRAA